MTAIERQVVFKPGPRFERDGEVVNFVYCLDASSTIGPRPATESDKANHKGAWEEFLAAQGSGPLDGDGDGSDGGSLPHETPPKRSYKRKVKPGDSAQPRPADV